MEAEEVAGSALSSASSKRGLLTLHQSLEALWDACETEGAPAAEELVAVGISAPELFTAAVRCGHFRAAARCPARRLTFASTAAGAAGGGGARRRAGPPARRL